MLFFVYVKTMRKTTDPQFKTPGTRLHSNHSQSLRTSIHSHVNTYFKHFHHIPADFFKGVAELLPFKVYCGMMNEEHVCSNNICKGEKETHKKIWMKREAFCREIKYTPTKKKYLLVLKQPSTQ